MLKWQSDSKALPDRVITGAEHILGLKLPAAYRVVAQAWPGGRPDRAEFKVRRSGGIFGSCIGVLLSLDPRESDSVFEYIRNLAVDDQLPAGLLPIVDDGGGDLICLDYRQGEREPAVVYWAHELGGEQAIVQVAPSFQAFLELLEEESTSSENAEEEDDGK